MNPLHCQFEETLCCREIIIGRLLFGHLDGLLAEPKVSEIYIVIVWVCYSVLCRT